MDSTRIRAVSGLALGLVVACGEPPGLPEAPCLVDEDCTEGLVCEDRLCREPGPRIPVGGGVLERVDAGPSDGGLDGGSPAPVDAGSPDGGGELDGGGPDAGVPDLGRFDGGASGGGGADGGSLDGGATGIPVPAGRYVYRRVRPTGLPTGTGLWQVALSDDDATLVVGTFRGRLYFVDRATEAVIREVELPRSGADSLRLGDLAFSASGTLLVAATAIDDGQPTGRLYELDAQGGKLTLLGTSRLMDLQKVVLRRGTADVDVLGYRRLSSGGYVMGLHVLDAVTGGFALVDSEPVDAGCQGLTRAEDGLGAMARVYTCGIGGGDIGHLDDSGTRFRGPRSVGNVSFVDAHPSGTYALAVGWAGARLFRFEQGRWTAGSAAPDLGTPRLQIPLFSTTGERALVFGGYERLSRQLEIREYRDGGYTAAAISDVSIAGFDQAPWLRINGSGVFDGAWRPGCDEGYLVGGCGELECGRGWLVHFEVANGLACSSP